MVDSGLLVAECALAAGVKRLVHVGSISGLYLGDPNEVITGATPPDLEPEKRNLYSRGKVEADRRCSPSPRTRIRPGDPAPRPCGGRGDRGAAWRPRLLQ